MWPLCFLLNKLLKVEERNQGRSEGHGDSTSEKYCQFDPCVSNGKYKDAGLPSSSYMEVRPTFSLSIFFCLCLSIFGLDLLGIEIEKSIFAATYRSLCHIAGPFNCC